MPVACAPFGREPSQEDTRDARPDDHEEGRALSQQTASDRNGSGQPDSAVASTSPVPPAEATKPVARQVPSRRNVWVDICRLVASLIIMVFHFPIPGSPVSFASGALLVEFFFMLTGYFAISHLRRRDYDTGCIVPYMKGFYLRVLPYVAVGVLLEYASEMITAYPDWGGMLRKASFLPFELLLLQSTNIYHSAYHVLWYLSITMICLPIVMYARKRFDGIWCYLVVMGPLLCYGLVMEVVGTLRVNKDIIDASRRAIGGMLLGGLVLILSDRLRRMELSRGKRFLLLVVEIGTLLVAGFLMTRPELEKTRHDSVTVFLLFCSLTIGLSGQTATSKIPAGRLTPWLAPVSLAIYCLHYGIFDLIKETVGTPLGLGSSVLGYAGTVSLAIVLVACVRAWDGHRKREKAPSALSPA